MKHARPAQADGKAFRLMALVVVGGLLAGACVAGTPTVRVHSEVPAAVETVTSSTTTTVADGSTPPSTPAVTEPPTSMSTTAIPKPPLSTTSTSTSSGTSTSAIDAAGIVAEITDRE